MEKVRCKMIVIAKGEEVVKLEPVYDKDPNSENGKFFAETPGGFVKLEVMNKKALSQFEEGKEYYLDFIRAE